MAIPSPKFNPLRPPAPTRFPTSGRAIPPTSPFRATRPDAVGTALRPVRGSIVEMVERKIATRIVVQTAEKSILRGLFAWVGTSLANPVLGAAALVGDLFPSDTPIREPHVPASAPAIDRPPVGVDAQQWIDEMQEAARIASEVYSLQQQIRQWEDYGMSHVAEGLRRQLETLTIQTETISHASPLLGRILKAMASAGGNVQNAEGQPAEADRAEPSHPVRDLMQGAAAMMGLPVPIAFMVDYGGAAGGADLSLETRVTVVTILMVGLALSFFETASDQRMHIFSNSFRMFRTPTISDPASGRNVTPFTQYALAAKPSVPMADFNRGAETLRQAEALWEGNDLLSHERSLELFASARDDLSKAFKAFVKTDNALHVPVAELLALAHLRLGEPLASSDYLSYAAVGHHGMALSTLKDSERYLADEVMQYHVRNAVDELLLSAELSARSAHLIYDGEHAVTQDVRLQVSEMCYAKAVEIAVKLGDAKLLQKAQGNLENIQRERDKRVFETMGRVMESSVAAKALGDEIGRWQSARVPQNQVVPIRESIARFQPPWLPFAGVAVADRNGVLRAVDAAMQGVSVKYSQLRQQLERMHGEADALRAVGRNEIRDELMNLARDWMYQAGFPYDINFPSSAEVEQQLADTEASMRDIAAQLEDPTKFKVASNAMVEKLTEAVLESERHGHSEAVTTASTVLVDFIQAHPSWTSDFIDILINRWRHHPELAWQTVGTIVDARPSLINRDQLIQIHGWSTVDPAANKALRRIESYHPDIFLVGP